MTAWRIVCPGALPAAGPFAALGIELCTSPPTEPARHTWFPAAGVAFDADTAARLFAVCEHLQADLAQPAFARDARALHAVARVHEGFQVRFTTLVDPAAPVLSARLLQQVGAPLARDAAHAQAWAQAAGAGRCVVVDAVPVAGAGSAPAAVDGYNLGGLLAGGDGCCLDDERDSAGDLLAWVLHANRDLPAGPLARYLAAHLAVPHAGLAAQLELALSAAGIGFNRVPVPPPEAAPPPSHDARRLAADLQDLRERHARVRAECDRQAALLAALATELRRAGAPA